MFLMLKLVLPLIWWTQFISVKLSELTLHLSLSNFHKNKMYNDVDARKIRKSDKIILTYMQFFRKLCKNLDSKETHSYFGKEKTYRIICNTSYSLCLEHYFCPSLPFSYPLINSFLTFHFQSCPVSCHFSYFCIS